MTFSLSDALVQLQWNGNVVSSATTNASEIFSIVLDPLQLCALFTADQLQLCGQHAARQLQC